MNTIGNDSDRSLAATRRIKARARCLSLFALGVALVASAHERIITIDAPGAGTGPFQGSGCFASTDCSVLINNAGAIAGYYLDASNVFHGYVRSPDGKFTTFNAPGADTNAGDFNGTLPNAINDAGAVTGVYFDVHNLGHGFLRSPGASSPPLMSLGVPSVPSIQLP